MNANGLKAWMDSAVGEVLEAMYFLSAEQAGGDADAHVQPEWVCTSLSFEGNLNGTFGIALPPATADTIACNFLGEEKAFVDEVQRDEVICELTNMVCGTFLSHVEAKRAFRLSKPMRDTEGITCRVGEDRISGLFLSEEGPLYAWLKMGDQR